MKENQAILQRQCRKLRFKNPDMDFYYLWAVGIANILGLSTSQIELAASVIKDGDPRSWVGAFSRLGDSESERAARAAVHGAAPIETGQAWLGAAYAYRAAMQLADPANGELQSLAAKMEAAFRAGYSGIGIPIQAVEIPFEGKSLPGYFLPAGEGAAGPRPVLIMVGGGDTFREDLFYFAGYPGWKRGYEVLMADLPGQGLCPDRGLTYRPDMYSPQKALLDWLEARGSCPTGKVGLYGVSGGGYFTALCAAKDARISAWAAATPIIDMAEVFRREFGAALKLPGPLLRAGLRLAGRTNRVAEAGFKKYSWQYGTGNFIEAARASIELAERVDPERVSCPTLALVSEGEGPELRRQAELIYSRLKGRAPGTELMEFTVAEGADAHCQLNNLRLLHERLFSWLDRRLGAGDADPRTAM
jgi:pimeloyl-ACP methyl ester carboxylesterase